MRSISTNFVVHGSPQKLLGVLAIAFLAAAAAGAAVTGPTVLAPLSGDTDAEALDISDSGWSVGVSADYSYFPAFTYLPVIWDKQGAPTALPLPAADCPEVFPFVGSLGVAQSINNRGEAVGLCFVEGFDLLGIRWDNSGNPTVLGIPAGLDGSAAFQISETGQAVGYSYDRSDFVGTLTAVAWDAAGTPTVLSPLEGDTVALARDVNNNGLAVGKSGFASVGSGIETAVVWDRNGVPTPLFPLAGDEDSSGWRINQRGEVLGVSYNDDGVENPVIQTPVKWDSNGNVTVLGPPVDSRVRAINDQGQAGGWLSPSTIPTLWSADGAATSLPVLDGDGAGHVHGLNNRGQAVGGSFGAQVNAVIWNTKGNAAATSVATSVEADATPDRTLTRRERKRLKRAQRNAERWRLKNGDSLRDLRQQRQSERVGR